jgi:hypothetical protein
MLAECVNVYLKMQQTSGYHQKCAFVGSLQTFSDGQTLHNPK